MLYERQDHSYLKASIAVFSSWHLVLFRVPHVAFYKPIVSMFRVLVYEEQHQSYLKAAIAVFSAWRVLQAW